MDKKVAKAQVKPVNPAGSGKLDAPIAAFDGVIHVDGDAFYKTGGRIAGGGEFPNVLVQDGLTGGKQVYFQQQMREQWADYAVNVPAVGNYEITMNAACINEGQVLEIVSNRTTLASVGIPLSFGLWAESKPVVVKLNQGVQTLRVHVPKSVAFELKPNFGRV